MRPLQHFSKDYLEQYRSITPEQIVMFLDDFRTLHGQRSHSSKSRFISLKVPEPLPGAFKFKAQLNGIPYQTQIKRLMSE